MNDLTIEGKLINVLEPQEGTSVKGQWKKQDFIIETTDQYPKKVCVSAWNDKTEELAKLKIGQTIKASINIESREYNSKWYTDVKVWKLEGGAISEPVKSATQGDDLPF